MSGSLRIRITVTVLLLIIVPLLLLASINGFQSSRYLRDQSLALQQEITLRVEKELRSYIDVRVDALSVLAYSVDFLALDRHSKKSKINRYLMHQHVYQEIILLDSDGMEEIHLSRTESMHPSEFEDRSKEEIFLFPKNSGQIYFGKVYFDQDLREPLLTVALPIVNRRDNRFQNVLIAVMRFKEIWNFLSDLSLPSSIDVYLAQKDGTIIAHQDMAKVISRETLDIQNNSEKEKVIDGEKIIAVRRDLHLGKETLIVYSTQPVSIAMKLVRENLQFVAGITLLVLLLIAPAVVFLTYRLLKPIEVLAKAARTMSGGDLNVQVTEPARGEVLELKNAFNSMAERLKVVVAELESSEFAERERALVTLKSIGEGVISTDASGKVDFINPIGEALTGWSSEESTGLPLYDVFHIISEETRDLAEDPVSRCLREGKVLGPANHTLLISRTGVEYAIENSAAPICGKDGQLLGVVLIFKDVSERKIAEARLQASELKFNVLFDKSPLTNTLMKLPEEIFIETNQAFTKMNGYRRDEVIGKTGLGLGIWVDPEDRNRYLQAMKDGNGSVHGFEAKTRRKDGTVIDVLLSGDALDIGGVNYILNVAQDITERKHSEQALHLTQFAMDRLSDGVFWINPDASFFYVNDAACRNLGYSRDELLRMTMSDVSPEFPLESWSDHWREIKERQHLIIETIHQSKDGRAYSVEIMINLLEHNGHEYNCAIARDITERKQAETALRSSLAEKESLLKEVHHRVKNNLQIISSLLNLQNRKIENPEVHVFLQDTQNRVRSMALLHETLYRSGNLAKVSFPLYVKSICAYLARSYAYGEDIRLRQNIDDVSLDMDQATPVGLIICELVANALKHAFPSQSDGEIAVELQTEGEDHLVLRVSDNGVGFPTEILLQSSETLGLILVRNLTRQLDGQMSVTSEQGSVFEIFFPAQAS